MQVMNSLFEYKEMTNSKGNYSRLCLPPFTGFTHNPVRGLLPPSPISFLTFLLTEQSRPPDSKPPNALICRNLGTVSKRYRETDIDGLNPHSSSGIIYVCIYIYF